MSSDTNIETIARKHFDEGFNCAEAILLASAKVFKKEAPNIPCIATPFGGGISGHGSICGAINGGLMVIGICHGRQKATMLNQKGKAYKLSDKLLADFKERFDSLYCKKLSGVNFKTSEGVKQYKEYVHTETCVPIVEFVAKWLEDNI